MGMTVKVNLLTVRLIRKVLLKGKREREEKEKKGQKKKKNKTSISTNEEGRRATVTSSFPPFIFLKTPGNLNPKFCVSL